MERGRDLKNNAVMDVIQLSHKKQLVELSFCFDTFAIAENLYLDVYGTDIDIAGIVDELAEGSERAVMALTFAAIHAADNTVEYDGFLTNIYRSFLQEAFHEIATHNISRMFYSKNYGEEPTGETEFQWVEYYKVALSLGMTDADFWEATPKKIALLTRNRESEEQAERLTAAYV